MNMKSLQLGKPHCLILVGLPSSGKTTFGERFAETFSAPFLNVEMLQAGDQSTQVAHQVLRQLFRTKQTIVYEGLGGSRSQRTEVARLARAHGYEPLLIWVQTDAAIARVRATKSTRRTPGKLSADQFESQVSKFSAPHASEKAIVLSGTHTYASQAKSVLKRLSAAARPQSPAPRQAPSTGRRLTVQ